MRQPTVGLPSCDMTLQTWYQLGVCTVRHLAYAWVYKVQVTTMKHRILEAKL